MCVSWWPRYPIFILAAHSFALVLLAIQPTHFRASCLPWAALPWIDVRATQNNKTNKLTPRPLKPFLSPSRIHPWTLNLVLFLCLSFLDRYCGLVDRAPGYWTEMYCASCEVRTRFIYVKKKKVDRLCGLVVRVPGYWTEMYCVSCEVRTEFVYVM
jgi:hypothetical protein